jgi:AcrR family transcriptional regulator
MSQDIDLSERFPRRTQRRQETRAKILKAAARSFRKFGFGPTTMNAIAEAADVHVTTLFTHFKNKRELAISLNDASIARLERLVEEAKGKTPFFDFFRDMAVQSAERIEHVSDPEGSLWSALRQDAELAIAWVHFEDQQVALLADYVAHEYGLDLKTDPRPELVANLMLASSRIAHRRWTQHPAPDDLTAQTRAAVDLAVTMCRAVLSGRG